MVKRCIGGAIKLGLLELRGNCSSLCRAIALSLVLGDEVLKEVDVVACLVSGALVVVHYLGVDG